MPFPLFARIQLGYRGHPVSAYRDDGFLRDEQISKPANQATRLQC